MLTGHGLKDAARVADYTPDAVLVDPSVESILEALDTVTLGAPA